MVEVRFKKKEITALKSARIIQNYSVVNI